MRKKMFENPDIFLSAEFECKYVNIFSRGDLTCIDFRFIKKGKSQFTNPNVNYVL